MLHMLRMLRFSGEGRQTVAQTIIRLRNTPPICRNLNRTLGQIWISRLVLTVARSPRIHLPLGRPVTGWTDLCHAAAGEGRNEPALSASIHGPCDVGRAHLLRR